MYIMESNGSWDEERQRGNTTKCYQINRLITAVKKKETCRLGKSSQADRAFDNDEFLQLVNLLGTQGRLVNNQRFQAMAKFQVHLSGRSDDMAHIQKCNLEERSQFSGFLSVKMCWSKNVHDKRDCPKQVILGCFDSTYCPVVGLALFLEKWIQDGAGATSQWLFGNGVSDSTSPLRDQNREATTTKNNYAVVRS